MYDIDALLERIPAFAFRPAHIGILPADGSRYYAWYDDGRGRTNETYLLHFTLTDIDGRTHLATSRASDDPVPVPVTSRPLLTGLSLELDAEQQLALAHAVRSLYVTRAMTVTHLQDAYTELAAIPRDLKDPAFLAARDRKVAIVRELQARHHEAVMTSRFANRINARLDAPPDTSGINYRRNW